MLFDDWSVKLDPLTQKYKERKHPLNYQNRYQLLIMVLLSAQDSDTNINSISHVFFAKYPTLKSISKSNIEELSSYLTSVKNYQNKAKWIFEIALKLNNDSNIPISMKALTDLKGIGRKSANVIIRESKIKAEGIIVDLHVLRVAPRIGLVAKTEDANKMEKQLIKLLPPNIWSEIGMSISFLGREICRPKNPKCNQCPINKHCNYSNSLK